VLREHNEIVTRIHKTLDLALVGLSFIAAYQIKLNFLPGTLGGGLSTNPNYYIVFFASLVNAAFVFRLAGFYQSYRRQSFYRISTKIFKATVGILFGVIVCLYLLHEQGVSRLLLLMFAAILTALLLLSKGLVYYTLRYYRSRDYNTRNVLIIGTGQRADNVVASLQREAGTGYRITGYLVPGNGQVTDTSDLLKKVDNLGHLSHFPAVLTDKVIDEVVFATDITSIEDINEYIQFAEDLGINVRIIPDFQIQKIMYRPETARVFMEEFAGIPSLALSTIPQRTGELLVKSCMDYIIAGTGLFLLAPIFVIIAAVIKITSPGPVFFIQQRCGLYGRIFSMLKFRTMVRNAEKLQKNLEKNNEVDGPVFKIKDDPRITPVGKFLRRTSLDELPQLINILKGEMSLVGPRPPIPQEVKKYESWQRRRLSMKPGLTCIWQVSGRNSINFADWMQMDLQYIDNWSLWLDVKILALTAKAVISGSGR
jgi:exopolysaccharide biosynthesis polyprenyl glycosylphosphotransferase